MQGRHLELAAAALDLLDQLPLDDRVEDDAGRLLHLLQYPLELLHGAHEGMHVLDRAHLRVLHGGRLGHGGQGLAGGIGDQMQMEVAGQHVGHVWIKTRVLNGCQAEPGLFLIACAALNKTAHRMTRRGCSGGLGRLHGDNREMSASLAPVNRLWERCSRKPH